MEIVIVAKITIGKYLGELPLNENLDVDDAFADSILNQFNPVSETELCHKVGPVSFDGLGANHEHIRDLLSRISPVR